MSCVVTVAIFAEVSSKSMGCYFVPLILFIALPTSALLTSLSSAVMEEDVLVLPDTNFEKSVYRLSSTIAIDGSTGDVSALHGTNMYTTTLRHCIENRDDEVTDESTVVEKYKEWRREEGKEKEKEINSQSRCTKNEIHPDILTRTENVHHLPHDVVGNITPKAIIVEENKSELVPCSDIFAEFSTGGEKSEGDETGNNSEDSTHSQNIVEGKEEGGKGPILPPSSEWPDYPVLVRRAPSSASRDVFSSAELLTRYAAPIKIHNTTIVSDLVRTDIALSSGEEMWYIPMASLISMTSL